MGGRSMMIWAAFGHNGTSNICFVDTKLNPDGYRNVLKNRLPNIGTTIGGGDWLFQQDEAPIHRIKANLPWFRTNKIKLLQWPSLSSDLNSTENLWGILAKRVYADGRQFYSKKEPKKAVKTERSKISRTKKNKLCFEYTKQTFRSYKT
ncbi:unnamed protein product [Didymodactylos carnosus]|uniref:Tc1-like transposase DDE domain-containing protein n=1 Tax=Didymodactylos carnosus TaxID=1234261 RepID=A0A815F838_9BILA|nr:unnamed protein product [Didymodactylos carnosus]CAF4165063.1 unnamed protein product [Didymodactylos carnosus]